MKPSISLLLLFFVLFSKAHTLDSLVLEDNTLLYHRIESKASEKKGLIIYMHGGVSQFYGMEKAISLPTEALLEGNDHFLSTMNDGGYDVLLPIAFNEYNWLTEKGGLFINTLIHQYREENTPVYVAGFSDGGTGAYRMFYRNPEVFEGLIVFNGFPQLDNFQRTVDYTKVTSKTIIFAGTLKDKRVPYEFLMVEFRRQQMLNENTFLMLCNGKHAFGAYEKPDFERCIAMMAIENKDKSPSDPSLVCLYPPLDALVVKGKAEAFYSFRKRQGKGYSMLPEEYERSDYDTKEFSKVLRAGGKVLLKPKNVSKSELDNLNEISFVIEVNGTNSEVLLRNWLKSKTW